MTTILIVDDSRTQLTLIKGWLERYGLHTLSADDGDQALNLAAASQPDLVLMDIVMPRVNGFQATRKMSRDPRTAGIPIILITSKNQQADRVWGLRQGATDFLVKPVSEQLLLSRVDAVLQKSAAQTA